MNKRILEVVVGICLLASCSEIERTSLPEIEATRVNIYPSIGKTAKVEVSLSQPHQFFIDYWETTNPDDLKTIHVPEQDELNPTVLISHLKENTTYSFAIRFGDEVVETKDIKKFQTAERPEAVDLFYDETKNQIETHLDGHFLFHRSGHPSVILLVDGQGNVVWYRTSPHMIKVANLTHRNTILTIESSTDQGFSDGDRILETNLAGDTLLLLNYGENEFTKVPHHDIFLTKDNHIVYLTQETQDEFSGDGILVLDRNGKKLWEWSSFSEFTNPDLASYIQPWGNSIVEDESAYYVSFRALSQIWKINKQSRQIDWKLGADGDFQLNDDSEFMFQHFAHFNHTGDLLLFDNGAAENRPYSRILSLRLTEQSQTLSPKTNIQLSETYFSPFMGSVQQLNSEEFLVCSATNGVILNVDHSGLVKWKLIAEDRMYRCVYIENLF